MLVGMEKDKDIHIRISSEKYSAIKRLAKKEYRKVTAVIDIALDNHLKSKKVAANGNNNH